MNSNRPERTAVKRWRDGDNGVDNRQRGEEENEQQHGHVEVVRSRGFEDSLVGNIAAHHSPTLQVHGSMQTDDIDGWEARCVKRAHPRNIQSVILSLKGSRGVTCPSLSCFYYSLTFPAINPFQQHLLFMTSK